MKLAILALFAVLVGAHASDMFESPNVVHLTSANYEELINDGRVYLVKYYAPWCGHCKHLAPVWKELGDLYADNTNVAIAHIDCTQAKDVCSTAGVKGYPTLKSMYKGEEYKAYRGARDFKALKEFVDAAVDELMTEA
jgi:protein disulfide-isomerase-like protein